jgi:glutathione peroxidase
MPSSASRWPKAAAGSTTRGAAVGAGVQVAAPEVAVQQGGGLVGGAEVLRQTVEQAVEERAGGGVECATLRERSQQGAQAAVAVEVEPRCGGRVVLAREAAVRRYGEPEGGGGVQVLAREALADGGLEVANGTPGAEVFEDEGGRAVEQRHDPGYRESAGCGGEPLEARAFAREEAGRGGRVGLDEKRPRVGLRALGVIDAPAAHGVEGRDPHGPPEGGRQRGFEGGDERMHTRRLPFRPTGRNRGAAANIQMRMNTRALRHRSPARALVALIALTTLSTPAAAAPAPAAAPTTPKPPEAKMLDLPLTDIDGAPKTLRALGGKALLLVNVASRCGFTRQYAGLEALYQKYKAQGLVIAGFPSNDFGGQEPGTEAEIKTFCSTKYNVTFPMFAKVKVKGPEKTALYQQLTTAAGAGEVGWNFTKFLVSAGGTKVTRFEPGVEPDAAELAAAIEAALK